MLYVWYTTIRYCTKRRKSAVCVIIVDTQLVVYQMCIFHGMLSFALNIFFFKFFFFGYYWNALLVTTNIEWMLILHEKWHIHHNNKKKKKKKKIQTHASFWTFRVRWADHNQRSTTQFLFCFKNIFCLILQTHVKRECRLWQKIWFEFRQGVLRNNLSYHKVHNVKVTRSTDFRQLILNCSTWWL